MSNPFNYMKKTFFLLTILVLFCSCETEYQHNLKRMKNICTKDLNDRAFKNNLTLNILEYKDESYIVRDENFLDTFRIGYNMDRVEHFCNLLKEQVEIMKPLSKQVRLYQDVFGSSDNLTQIAIEDIKDESQKFDLYKDSFNFYIKQDSIIRERIKNRVNPKPIYYYKAFFKAIYKDNNSDQTANYADTLYYVFDENFNIVRH